jgi:hypothetical protein
VAHIRRNKVNNAFHGIDFFSRSSFSACQEISCLLYNLKVSFPVDRSPPLYSIMNHHNPVRTFIFCSLRIHLNLSVYGSTVLLFNLGRFFSFLILYTVGRTPWTGDQPVAGPLPTHRTTQIQNKRTHASMPWVGFEPMISTFKRTKEVHALDGRSLWSAFIWTYVSQIIFSVQCFRLEFALLIWSWNFGDYKSSKTMKLFYQNNNTEIDWNVNLVLSLKAIMNDWNFAWSWTPQHNYS